MFPENNSSPFDFTMINQTVEVIKPFNLYKWNKKYFKLQSGFFVDEFKLVREKQIEDFVYLNGFNKVWIDNDTDVFKNDFPAELVSSPSQADLMIVLNQNFSRRPCPAIIEQIQKLLEQCPNLYLGLNRHYINIDNSFIDTDLPADFEQAITHWLRKNLPTATVMDHSFRWDDRGTFLTWSLPDRQYYITRK